MARRSCVGRPPAPTGPEGRRALRLARVVRTGEPECALAERVGVGLHVRAGQLSASAAHTALEDAASTGTGAPVALAWGSHSNAQLAGIGCPSR